MSTDVSGLSPDGGIEEQFRYLLSLSTDSRNQVLQKIRQVNSQQFFELQQLLEADQAAEREGFLAPLETHIPIELGVDEEDQSVDGTRAEKSSFDSSGTQKKNNALQGVETVKATDHSHFYEDNDGEAEVADESDDEDEQKERIGDYQISRLLGKGAYGLVFEARKTGEADPVAIKVLRKKWCSQPKHVEQFLSEARQTQGIHQEGIVRILEVNSDNEQPFIVQELIDGWNLEEYVRRFEPDRTEIINLVIKLTRIVVHIHQCGIYHRDLKPANILVDKDGCPHIVDFGLAMRFRDGWKRRGEIAGTVAYMSPEQLRGESHLVTASSDIWSIGVILYELLAKTRPFLGEAWDVIFAEIEYREPRGLREIDPSIPTHVQWICLKCLTKEINRRYRSASDLLDDLQREHSSVGHASLDRVVKPSLRSFGAEDHEAFLELLPGIRDADGIPECLSYWTSRMTDTGPSAFRIGVLSGLSGSGKSSLIQAGLLPLLRRTQIRPVLIRATAERTEQDLRKALVDRFAFLRGLSLPDSFCKLRESDLLARDEKVLIIIDQFEQWLYAHSEDEGRELVHALRQCDGQQLQVVLCIRDGFIVSLKRLLLAVDAELDTTKNYAIIDLLSKKQAKVILERFGRGCEQIEFPPTPEQEQFLNSAVDMIAGTDNRVVCIQLVILATMMSDRPWVTSELQRIGGLHGIGVQFLEDQFASRLAPETQRIHLHAAIGVLSCLLPATETGIRGNAQSIDKLRQAAGYDGQSGLFDELVTILGDHLRLITPVDFCAEQDTQLESDSSQDSKEIRRSQAWYELTHDYLVPAVRDWVAKRKQVTRRGRAELRLIHRTNLWITGQESRQFPTWLEWLQIRLSVPRTDWTPQQKEMMTSASRYHYRRFALFGLFVFLSVFTTGAWLSHSRSVAAVEHLGSAEINEVPPLLEKVWKFDYWTNHQIETLLASPSKLSRRETLNYRLALLRSDPDQVDPLVDALLSGTHSEVTVISDALQPHADKIESKLWVMLQDATTPQAKRLRSAVALATWSPQDSRWAESQEAVVDSLMDVPLYDIGKWTKPFQPCRSALLPVLQRRFFSDQERVRVSSAVILCDLLTSDPALILELIKEAQLDQLSVLASAATRHGEGMTSLFKRELQSVELVPTSTTRLKFYCAEKSNVAAVWLRIDPTAPVWHLLSPSTNIDLRSHFIHRLGPVGVPIQSVLDRYLAVSDVSEKLSLALALGEYRDSGNARSKLIELVKQEFDANPDPGIHSAMQWLANVYGFADDLQVTSPKKTGRAWQVLESGHTMVRIEPQGNDFAGNPDDQREFEDQSETQRKVSLPEPFWIATTEVTEAQWYAFRSPSDENSETSQPNRPKTYVDQEDAMAYCLWLSKQANIPEDQYCYQETKSGRVRPYPDYLKRKGFRLPTEDEWEFACRAGTTTSRYFGELATLLPAYAWGRDNSNQALRKVGLLKPNQFGLFDMIGNVEEWCQNAYDPQHPRSTVGVIRGSNFLGHASSLHSMRRRPNLKSVSLGFAGFRIVCTSLKN
ncbi:bifunctional serine/threonine-protein kinase/formylglycine-generating enzyme family protein [Thalassoroseus pseudoceratinae]|uniref:bifunctional serine/threonine-protein kinase/formylglycine-generating enzyme family protein n=1 Tax=Thalassoroseus pseudoceratinae TaxID=2713176 RepID=UPI001424638D|nr:bifunctional serine/threonine-protein kinase/formylglycine-generating enzyme family protein [Thalassoroseus pseudoceratinae]